MKKTRQDLDFIGFLAPARQWQSEVPNLCGARKISRVQFQSYSLLQRPVN